jgi:hypothetical protein
LLEQPATTVCKKETQGYVVTHGTSAQRKRWLLNAFNSGQVSACDTLWANTSVHEPACASDAGLSYTVAAARRRHSASIPDAEVPYYSSIKLFI